MNDLKHGTLIDPAMVDIFKRMPRFITNVVHNPAITQTEIQKKLKLNNFNMIMKIEDNALPKNKIKVMYNDGEVKEVTLGKKKKENLL
jgi:hypothetical protein